MRAAIVRWASAIWAAAFPTLSTGGFSSAIINSTPYGMGNFYHSTWVDAAIAGGKSFQCYSHYIGRCTQNGINLGMTRWLLHWVQKELHKKSRMDGRLLLSSGNTVFEYGRYQGYRRLLKVILSSFKKSFQSSV